MKRLLILEKDPPTLEALETVLRGLDFDVAGATTVEQGYRKATADTPECILVDYSLRGTKESLEFINWAKTKTKVIVLTTDPNIQLVRINLNVPVLTKPFLLEDLVNILTIV
jgi:DNA-binding response OmpR family regulator